MTAEEDALPCKPLIHHTGGDLPDIWNMEHQVALDEVLAAYERILALVGGRAAPTLTMAWAELIGANRVGRE